MCGSVRCEGELVRVAVCLGLEVSVCMGVCPCGGQGVNTYRGKATSFSWPLSSYKLLSKPGNDGQAVIRFLQGGGQNRADGRVADRPPGLQGPPDPPYCGAHLPGTGLLGLTRGTYLETVLWLEEERAGLFSSVQK